jgi:hypothetical protein
MQIGPGCFTLAVAACIMPVTTLAQSPLVVPDALVPAGLTPGSKYQLIFTTGSTYRPSSHTVVPPASPNRFGGIPAADYQVTFAAAVAGWIPSWNGVDRLLSSILSTASSPARDRLTITAPVYNTHGELVANDSTELWSSNLRARPGYDEFGNAVSGGVWTGTSGDGTWSCASCADWNDPLIDVVGKIGDASSTNQAWIDFESRACNTLQHLYGLTPELTVLAAPGDYNEDGDVDTLDYEAWRGAYGTSGPELAADGNRDGTVNAFDIVLWRDNLAAGATLAHAAPEPPTWLLLCWATMTRLLRLRPIQDKQSVELVCRRNASVTGA